MEMHQNKKNDVFIWEWNQSKYRIGENFNSRTRPEQDQDNFENLEWKPKSDLSRTDQSQNLAIPGRKTYWKYKIEPKVKKNDVFIREWNQSECVGFT